MGTFLLLKLYFWFAESDSKIWLGYVYLALNDMIKDHFLRLLYIYARPFELDRLY